MSENPILFDDETDIDIEAATPIDAEHTAMGAITTRAARRTGWLGRIFITTLTTLLLLVISLQFWDFVNSLISRNQLLGNIVIGLGAILVITILLYVLHEIWAMLRLNRVDHLRQGVHDVRISGSREDAQKLTRSIARFYNRSPHVNTEKWQAHSDEMLDAVDILNYAEEQLLSKLDQEAKREIEKRSRQVAMVTAFVPIALADLLTVLSANIGMIRRIAEIYGGRPGFIGGLRLFRKVATHLVATGAVAVGDDVIGSVMGGNLLGKLSRRFGEGVINAALTTRVGIAAIEVCRPMDFHACRAPSTSALTAGALTNFMSKS